MSTNTTQIANIPFDIADVTNEARMEEALVQYHHFKDTATTVCCITTYSGFSITGVSSGENVAEFDEELGKKYAYHSARMELIPYFVFLNQQVPFMAQEIAKHNQPSS